MPQSKKLRLIILTLTLIASSVLAYVEIKNIDLTKLLKIKIQKQLAKSNSKGDLVLDFNEVRYSFSKGIHITKVHLHHGNIPHITPIIKADQLRLEYQISFF